LNFFSFKLEGEKTSLGKEEKAHSPTFPPFLSGTFVPSQEDDRPNCCFSWIRGKKKARVVVRWSSKETCGSKWKKKERSDL